ncbi:Asp23/Gls24 family envelope stress response protein [Micromonospora sp. DR5-3]|uniref:Asp23/Gls24 family envelope stress response protein n=1 Tax=unclassified Micromonospora TaxID=2617518 RepID=UPI0011D4E259|nr:MULTISPECIES: Asp23/Gls24 family envelope stress response protein [unclassified Micromonospora]MCW3815167.1 Asp23/Gls24 family envelope stress response protein [Micromonospora sp. DR5-3]TYC22206.1 Asp23/Gls24 family envelope stress response protein [Micromonospora sp. MP36]
MTGTLPRRATAVPGGAFPPARPWTEERLARLVEDVARLTPAVSGPVATVRVDGPAARIDLDLVVNYGVHLPTVAAAVRRRVTARIAAHTGLAVESVTVTVVDVVLDTDPPYPGGDGARGRAVTAAGG